MAKEGLLLDALSHFARTLVQRYDVAEALLDLTERLGAYLDVPGVGIAVDDGRGVLLFAAARDEVTARVERIQEELQEGPCVAARDAGGVVAFDDLGGGEHWPRFGPLAIEAGMCAAAGVPLVVEDRIIGAIDLYDVDPRPWSPAEIAATQVFGTMATALLVGSSARERAAATEAQLRGALDTRIVIEQAKGVIAERHEIGIGAAFDRIRHHARSHNLGVRAVAHAIVALDLDLPE